MNRDLSRKNADAPLPDLSLDACSLSQGAFEHIRLSIFAGELRPGEKIPEERIAHMLQVSRTPIREALRRLERYGLVVIKPRSYAMVADISDREVMQIARIRCELEKLGARYLLANASLEDIHRLRTLAESILDKAHSDDIGGALLLDGSFHMEMIRRSGNETLYGVLESIDAKCQLLRVRKAAAISAEKLVRQMEQHVAIVDRLEAGDEAGVLTLLECNIVPELEGDAAPSARASDSVRATVEGMANLSEKDS